MSLETNLRNRLVQSGLAIFLVGGALLWSPPTLRAQEDGAVSEAGIETNRDPALPERSVRFSFRYTPWPEVLKWIAEQCELSFNLDYTPKGTFNFVDETRMYTPTEALDEINGALLAKGYTLARRHQSLYIIDLENDLDKKFIRDLLNETSEDELDRRGRFELAKVRFQLRTIEAELAEQQVQNLIGPQGSIVTIPAARQLIVTETGGNLRTIKGILELIQSRAGELHSFRLQHANGGRRGSPWAKPLLGIAEDEKRR